MRLIAGATLACVIAGGLIIILGFVLGISETRLRKEVRSGVEQANSLAASAQAAVASPPGPGGAAAAAPGIASAAQQQGALLGSASDYVKALSGLASSLSGLSQATQSFLVGSILFFFAASLAAVDILH